MTEEVAEEKTGSRPKTMEGQGPSQLTKVYLLVLRHFGFVASTEGELFALRRDGRGDAFGRPLSVSQNMAMIAADVTNAYYVEHGAVVSTSVIKDAVTQASNLALQAPRVTVHLRYAHIDGSIYIDIADDMDHVIEVTPKGWAVLDRAPEGVYFRRTALTQPMVIPVRGGSIETLREVANVTDEDWPLLVGWMLGAVQDTPRPVLYLHGVQGATKTSTGEMLINILDPSSVPMRTRPRDEKHWEEGSYGSQIIGYDNLTLIPEWLADQFCAAVTGNGVVKRSHYENHALAVAKVHCALILTSTGVGTVRGDLADRMISVEIEPPPTRLKVEEIRRWSTDNLPAVLGAYLDLLVQVMAKPSQDIDLPRMADFGDLLARLDAATGWKSLDAFRRAGETLAFDALDDSPFLAATVSWMKARPSSSASRSTVFEGTASSLLAEVQRHFEPSGQLPSRHSEAWPKTPASASRLLRLGAKALEAHGVLWSSSRSNRARLIKLELKR